MAVGVCVPPLVTYVPQCIGPPAHMASLHLIALREQRSSRERDYLAITSIVRLNQAYELSAFIHA